MDFELLVLKAATSSKDEWQGKELGTHGGKAVHMLIHHSSVLILILAKYSHLFSSLLPL